MNSSTLVNGRTYFRLTFADPDLTVPGVEPLVYLSEVTEEGGTKGFAFQDALSFVHHGSGLEGDEQHEDIVLYFLPESELGALFNIEELAAELVEAARRAITLNHPPLKVRGSNP